MPRQSVAPASGGAWEIQAEQLRVEDSAIYEINEIGSGSKVTEKQFLATRVLWKEHRKDSQSITDKIVTEWYAQSKAILDED